MTTAEAHSATVFDSDFVQHLHANYERIRAETPVRRLVTQLGLPVWVVTRYEEAREALGDPRLAKDADGTLRVLHAKLPLEADGRIFSGDLSAHMLNTDPPDHTRLRKLVVKAFTPRRVEALRPRVEAITAELLDGMARESEVDLLDAFAFPLPIRVICELLGVDESRRSDFRAWTNAILDATEDRARADEAIGEMTRYLVELIEAKRERPADDLLTALLQVSEDEDRLSVQELVSMVFLLLVAGHETTVNLIGNGVLALLRHPDQWAALRADPDLVDGAVEEVLRYDGPVMHGTFRHTTAPVRLGGVEIPEGEAVWVGLSSANRDPRQFPDPDRFDIGRDAHGHVAFGHGIHFCLGAQLARLEGQVALRRVVERFPDLRLAGSPDDVQWRFSSVIHGLRELRVRPRG
ncbi:cytochrome P450 family protein [Saccharopolyspora rosea]|uniref:Cytochrome P450 n=1 Tax=Saccharopolyspora rosea TaxID=524884 RepID=A0ABW3FSS6_9PSEU|nr:cytochrome P450 [Saccharopolyspora rosea]